ncbi:universal stress protein [Aromatoleum evansii]|uniref:universal stress protein n=1 Tax=Aromatoleum evansii TaxID=59406 RepID=UPI00145E1CE0|nr:universal stress protein [Aromatoleum evansii]NMG29636.1 universal stress protein [Aromatoleum evansii]
MLKLNHLLAATDLSAPARHAVERAALVSRETGTPLDVLHVADLAPLDRLRHLMGNSADDLKQQVLKSARERLHELVGALQNHYGITADAHIAFGSLLAELGKAVDASAADLIVCGARGESFLRHVLLGSTAERMLSRATCPMLVVKQAAHEPYRSVLVPVDFSASSLQAICNARLIAPQAQIVLLHAFDVPFEGHLRYAGVEDEVISGYRLQAKQEAIQNLNDLSEQAGLPPYEARLIVLQGHPSTHIIEQEQEADCDLIVMGKHGQSMLDEFFVGSVTKHVLAESQCDVMVSV